MLGAGRSAIRYSVSPSRPHPNHLDPYLKLLSVGEDLKTLARLREKDRVRVCPDGRPVAVTQRDGGCRDTVSEA